MTNHRAPLVALDFDGVIHSYLSGWKGECVVNDPPVPGAFEFICQLLDAGYRVAIISTRMSPEPEICLQAQQRMMDWLIEYDFPPEKLALLEWWTHKPPAILTIDDRSMCFVGKWPNLQDLFEFRPYKIDLSQEKRRPRPVN